ncbi:MAG TPA: tail fiber domain-containing protein [Pyrinomonadaceae bacterium]|nr:tail fiber domain-containing protein [Chloracidobacterium sp.]HQX55714.1 tail fiber domain-containing protein [Pyrinomonadaceae bacterium]MBK7801820.1 tail fiber domain-containing protein [Chloracidobacterium sp.]MBK9438031.1 tail fiber domain-containing protein [Chloracidobacterium sp.]MBL0242130.1 tail fiber domain-containing protein [Chloracidobacterium sp.]
MKILAAIVIFLTIGTDAAIGQSSEFNYQGNLQNSGVPANGNYDMQFTVYDASTGGNPQGSTMTKLNVAVTNGVFGVVLDIGVGAFRFNLGRYLEIAVRPAGGGSYTVLTPRHQFTATPYALSAVNARDLGGVSAASYVLTTDPRMSDARDPLPNFDISGNGTVSGILSANQFNIGSNRFIATDQFNNLAIGVEAGGAVNDGSIFNNSFVGFRAGKNSNGLANSFFGAFAGEKTISGSRNSFFGAGSGISNVGGNDNSLFGFDAGRNRNGQTATGSRNTIIGSEAGLNMTGSANTFLGGRAGFLFFPANGERAGSFTTAIGADSGINADDLEYATAIGAGAQVSASNTIQLGRQNGLDAVLVPGRLQVNGGGFTVLENGNVGIGTNPTFRLDVADRVRIKQVSGSTSGNNSAGIFLFQNSPATERAFVGMENDSSVGFFGVNGGGWSLVMDTGTGRVKVVQLGSAGSTALCRNASNEISTCSSSARYKDNINTFTSGLELIRKLRPVSFNWKDGGIADMGLVAEEVNAVEPLLTSTNDQGEVEGVKYDRIGVVLINAVKEQQSQIEAQQREINELKQIVCELRPTAKVCLQK